MTLRLVVERVETTQPGQAYRTWKPGRRRAVLALGVPLWLATVLHACGVRVID